MLRTLFLMDEISNYGWVTKWNFLTLGEFQQQIYVQRLELEDAHLGYVESRREQVRQEGQLVMKRKVFETLTLEVFTKWENWRELRNCESTNSPYKNWEKVMWYDAEALFTGTRVAREGAWMIPENFRRLKAFSHRRTRSDFFRSLVETIFGDQIETNMRPRCEKLVICEFLQRARRFGKRQLQSATKLVVCYNDLDRGFCLREQCTGQPDPNGDDTQVVKYFVRALSEYRAKVTVRLHFFQVSGLHREDHFG